MVSDEYVAAYRAHRAVTRRLEEVAAQALNGLEWLCQFIQYDEESEAPWRVNDRLLQLMRNNRLEQIPDRDALLAAFAEYQASAQSLCKLWESLSPDQRCGLVEPCDRAAATAAALVNPGAASPTG